METMKAMICTKYGPPEVLQIRQYQKPTPRADEVLIKVYATAVTNSDLFIRGSNIPLRFMIPMRLMLGIRRPRNPIIGEVLAGKIECVGSAIKRFHVGDHVYGLTGFSLGAYAEYKCMKETDSKQGCLAVMPSNISFEAATSAAYGGLLALQSLEKGHIMPGQNVLVYGASSTSGTFATQYAKYLGATVTGVCGPSNMDFITSLGADRVFDYTRKESVQCLDEYNLVIDTVGKRKTSELKMACMHALRAGGKYVSIDDDALVLRSDRLNKITELVELGAIKPITDRVYPFEEMIEAHRYVETGHKKGNVAITVNTTT